jgi:hypothetical protein
MLLIEMLVIYKWEMAGTHRSDTVRQDAINFRRSVIFVEKDGLRDGEMLRGFEVCVVSVIHE